MNRSTRGCKPEPVGLPATLLSTACLLGFCILPTLAHAEDAFKIMVVEEGAYSVSFEDLAAAGLEAPAVSSDALELSHRDQPVPIWLKDGGDGRFEPGDHLEFLGRHLAGESTYYFPHSPYNVYRLRSDSETSARMSAGHLSTGGGTQPVLIDRHDEKDLLRIRLRSAEVQNELWYWAKIIGGYPAFQHELELPFLDPDAQTAIRLRLELRGWSRPRTKGDPGIPDHQVEVAVNGLPLAQIAWNGEDAQLVEVDEVPADVFVAGPNRLEVSSPRRQEADGDPLVDVMLLNWIEIEAGRTGRIGGRQSRLTLSDPGSSRAVRVSSDVDPAEDLLVFGDSGWRLRACGKDELLILPEAEDRVLTVTPGSKLARPVRIVLDQPSNLRRTEHQADYVMITHGSLREAIEPLANFHRSRGLAVSMVDVEDVYDEFSFGIEDPRAIREFLSFAFERWTRPAPRFVLLVGDASWDARNEVAIDANYADWTNRPFEIARFVKNRSTPYPALEGEASGPPANDRHLIPTLSYLSRQGPAASDHAFVAFNDPGRPDLAIGRLPVTEPDEVAAIVEKTIRYVTQAETEDWEPEDWRQKIVYVTSEARGLQRVTDRVATAASVHGYEPIKVYPESEATSNEATTGRLIDAIDDGATMVYFHGHGGRYIWRTGPRDLEKNHDLLTLDDLDRLTPSAKLPVIVSMTCYSAPFDHPSADSIGEKLLRMEERGSAAVIAASWRSTPRASWGETLVREFALPDTTVGEALMRTKREFPDSELVHLFNLLGDPALPVPGVSAGGKP